MQKFNYNHLYYFWVIANQGNLGKAAELLQLSDSALSTQLKKFETQLQTELFERKGRGLTLTDAGRFTLQYANRIFELGHDLQQALVGNQVESRQLFRIGIASSLSRNFAENFIRPLITNNAIELVIESGNQHELLAKLALSQLDVVLSNRKPDSLMQLTFSAIAKQPISIVGKPLANQQSFQIDRDLSQFKMLLPSLGSELRTDFDQLCQQRGWHYQIMAEINDMPALRLFLRDASCIALVPKVVVQDEINNHSLQEYCQIEGLYEQFYAIYHKHRVGPDVLQGLLQRKDEEVLNYDVNVQSITAI